jgi:hypothetical protein
MSTLSCVAIEQSKSWRGFKEHSYAFVMHRDVPLIVLLQTECETVAKALMQMFMDIETSLSRNTHAVFELQQRAGADTHLCVSVPDNDDEHPDDRLACVRGVTESCMSCNSDVPLYRGLNRRDPPDDPELAALVRESERCLVVCPH